MKITYAKKPMSDGRTVFNVDHNFSSGIPLHDQITMATRAVLRKYDDSECFEWYVRESTGQICGGRARLACMSMDL